MIVFVKVTVPAFPPPSGRSKTATPFCHAEFVAPVLVVQLFWKPSHVPLPPAMMPSFAMPEPSQNCVRPIAAAFSTSRFTWFGTPVITCVARPGASGAMTTVVPLFVSTPP